MIYQQLDSKMCFLNKVDDEILSLCEIDEIEHEVEESLQKSLGENAELMTV